MRRFLVPICALFVACGGGGESIDPDADEERIEDALITLDDLPDGFEQTTDDDAEDEDDDNECNQEILDIDEDELDENEVAETERVQFEDETTSVRAQIQSFRNRELPQRVLDAIDDDDYVDCLEERVVENLDGGEISGLDEVDTPVDGGRALQFQFVFGDGVEVVSQQHSVLVDRFGITLQVTAVEGGIDDDLVEDLLETMVERLEDGEGS